MYGRAPVAMAVGLLVGLAGCQSLPGRLFSGGKKGADDVVLKPSTYVAFADYRAQAGFNKDLPEEAQLQYREESRLSYLKGVEADPKCLPAHLGLARLLTNWGKHGEALASYEKAIELSPEDGGLWYEKGMCQCRQRDWGAATASLSRAVELAPQQRSYRSHLGLALARSGRYAEGLARLTEAVGEAQAHYDMARLLETINEPALARHHAAEALSRDPNLTGARAMLTPAAPATPTAAPVRTVSHQASSTAPLPQIITPGAKQPEAVSPPRNLPPGIGDTLPATKPTGDASAIPLPPPPVISIRGK